jgi:serine/threonine protein phosphatase PrpC
MDSTTSAESEDEVSIDIFNDIRVVSAQAKGAKEGECEDRVIDKFTLPLGYMNSSASCVMLAVLDGHGGSLCVDYVQKQLGVSVIAALRNPQKRKGSDSETLQTVLRKAFQNTDHNFMYLAKRSGNSSGSTIAFATMFGPDASDGSLRVLLGSLGDSRAVLFRLDRDDLEQKRVIAVASSPVHKPSGKSEMRRIQSQGGQVCNIQGIERVIKKVNQTTFGLSVSRAFGDLPLKEPNMVISNVPDFTEQTIDFDLDQFLVLATDGVFDFVSFEQVGKLIANAERTEKGLKKAAEEILILAKSQGSADDRTCVIVDFSWARRFAPVQQEIERASEKDTSDADDDDIFNIHQT